ncbi:MAG: hypothetical protein ABF283_06060, partial [Planktotalea arctica]
AQNDSYFAGDHAELTFAAAAVVGQYQTQMRTFRSSDVMAIDGDDRFTTGDGDVRAILGVGSDVLVQGNGLGYVIGDLGLLDQDNRGSILSRIESQPEAITLVGSSKDSWTAGRGEHVGVLGADDDTVVLGDGPVQVLLDHGYIQRSATNGKLIHAEDEVVAGWGNDSLVAGTGWGVVIGGGGNDTIATGRTQSGAVANSDGRHVILGDAGYVQFDPRLSGAMELIRVEARKPDIFGSDTLSGGAGRDIVIGGAGSDEVHGETGRDFVAGDFLLMNFENGLVRDVLVQRDLYFQGAGDLITTGYDGDFVFGGTQFNRLGVASSVDIIFETFGRILFESGRDIDKIERMFNMGVASSLLDARVQDGQVGSASRSQQTSALGEDLIGSGSLGGLTGQEDIVDQGIDSSFSGAPLSLTETAGPAAATFLPAAATDEEGEQFAQAQQDGHKDATQLAAADLVQTIRPASLVKAGAMSFDARNASDVPEFAVQSDDEMLDFLEEGMLAMSTVAVFRNYGKSRSVGSLEQRLRAWTESGFALRGADQGDGTHMS